MNTDPAYLRFLEEQHASAFETVESLRQSSNGSRIRLQGISHHSGRASAFSEAINQYKAFHFPPTAADLEARTEKLLAEVTALRDEVKALNAANGDGDTSSPSFDDDTLAAMSRIVTGMFNPDAPPDESLVSEWKEVNGADLPQFTTRTLNKLAHTAAALYYDREEESDNGWNACILAILLQWASHIPDLKSLVV